MSAENGYHEPVGLLSDSTKQMHRALVSLIEELEAIDWYQQRADACDDEALAAILLHNKVEEIEHAMMALEWIRRGDPDFDRMIRTYLRSDGPIVDLEAEEGAQQLAAAGSRGEDLGIRGLRERGDR